MMMTEYAYETSYELTQKPEVDVEEKLASMRAIEQSEFWSHVIGRLTPVQLSLLKAELRRCDSSSDRA